MTFQGLVSAVSVNGAFWTAAVGIAGIAAAFFAPTYSQTKIEQRRERRTFQRAQRLVVSELRYLAENLSAYGNTETPEATVIALFRETEGLDSPAWEANMQTLADGLPLDVWVQVTDIYRRIDLGRRWMLKRGGVPGSLREIFRNEAALAVAAADSLEQATGDFV